MPPARCRCGGVPSTRPIGFPGVLNQFRLRPSACARRLALLAACIVAALALPAAGAPASAWAAAGATPSAAQQLADMYSPIVMVRTLKAVCNTAEEQYSPPTSVGIVLGNPAVRLLYRNGRQFRVVSRAPTAKEIAGLGPGYYMDLPGDPLVPECRYAKDFRALRQAGHAPAVAYAHIARQPGVPGFALQYWFYYYFNQFNDLHESDWEGMQLWFEQATPQQALNASPAQIVLFQHAGGEHTDWDDGRVQKDGNHPIVYSAAGSHATFYGSALYLGNGQGGSGVGCDNTTGPLTEVRPRAVLTPEVPVARGPFAWLTYTGRWGQLEAGFNNGPAGPNTKTVWLDPYTWMEGTRTGSPTVPAGSIAGPSIAHLFCGTVSAVTGFLNLADKTLPGALAVAAVALLIVLTPVFLTTWRPTAVFPVASRRKLGQILLASARLCFKKSGTVVMMAVSVLLLIAAFDVLEYLVLLPFGVSTTGLSFNSSQKSVGIFTSAGAGQPIVAPIADGLAIAMVWNLSRRAAAGIGPDVRALASRFWRVVGAQIVVTVTLLVLGFTVIGIPYAIYKVPQWQFAAQEVMFEDCSIREAIRGSTRVVRGHWWVAASRAFVFILICDIPGPVIGFALLFAPVHPGVVNVIGAVIYSLLLPFATVGRTMVYLDLKMRPQKQRLLARHRARRRARVADAPAT